MQVRVIAMMMAAAAVAVHEGVDDVVYGHGCIFLGVEIITILACIINVCPIFNFVLDQKYFSLYCLFIDCGCQFLCVNFVRSRCLEFAKEIN